ncbi:LuxR family transcriptional regulator [Aeromicrobium wangtongii]|uniref:LuxR family transcriptional regulator n=1 Tax=Aeromicrobium wangtongii TaxID=2969247 RepID=A0ABY5MF76_9ACTN|nr:LuxR family transcriptional regulator [Aeromicrobium wangtongii]MCD9197924.1 LuxR family transcriptional regulator [Aeromicrobium wangtongii]UUP15402.1 LuxR family transcriptional regulator [Aeromicrobium wangtongii]
MGSRLDAFEPALVGRPEELAVLAALLERAGTGRAGTLLIAGDAGVGKTALVQRACSKAASTSSVLVLAGACLPLASLSVPFLAIRSALRDARHDGIPMPPAMDSADSPANAPIVFDTWLDDLARDRAVVLAVDDLHWADQSTLDVRAAESLLLHDRHHRAAAAAHLRRGLSLAEDLAAVPLQRELQSLATTARIRTGAVGSTDGPAPPHETPSLLGLTTREREILAHVVAGRTYGEIARDLMISEKTVSSHISHLLHKTGTANRVDLARLAARAHRG